MQLCGRHYVTGQPIVLELAQGRIAEIRPLAIDEHRLEACPWICPGLLDVQVNGYGGQEISDKNLTAAKVGQMIDALAAFGVTRFCPTVTTQSSEVMLHAIATIAAACRSSQAVARRIAGIHVEGPYITRSEGARGAHPLAHVRPPDWDEFQRFQEAADGRIRILTMSPEYDHAASFVRQVAQSGVVVAIGHTSATPDQIRAAVDAGARLSTHLGNGSHPMLHRLHNYLWEQLADDRLMASLISDGHHLPPAVVKSLVRGKTPERCILISDLSGQAGQPPGRYTSEFCDVEILPNGKLVIAGQRELLAGAALPLNVCLANAITFAGVALPTAVEMAVHNPARLLGLEADELQPGGAANVTQFDLVTSGDASAQRQMTIRATVFDGELVHGSPWTP
jgi:N-acetylglucosamine-6-phosphate deacetylase